MDFKCSCVKCEGEIKGSVFGIRPKFCCVECCANFPGTPSRYYHKRLISSSAARSRYNCTVLDLKELNYKTETNPIVADGPRMRLFLEAEVNYLKTCKDEAIKREAKIECALQYACEQIAIEQKKDRLEEKLGISLGNIDTLLRTFLLGDYLKCSQGTLTTRRDVLARFHVIDRVREILKLCPGAYPGAVFEFAVAYPRGGVEEFLDLQERGQKALREEGDKIMRLLTIQDKQKLPSSLKEIMQVPRPYRSGFLIRWHLHYRGVANEDYLQIYSTDSSEPRRLLILQRGTRLSSSM